MGFQQILCPDHQEPDCSFQLPALARLIVRALTEPLMCYVVYGATFLSFLQPPLALCRAGYKCIDL